MQIRACQAEDLPQIQRILQVSQEAAAWSGDSLKEALGERSWNFLVAREGLEKELAGFILGRRVHDQGEILNLAVKPELRRRGVARSLVKAQLDIFGSEGVAEVWIEVRESNAAGIAFYRALGFRQTGARTGYYRDPVEAALVLAWKREEPESTDGTD